jgi:glyceraldehyde 3-phosphate dehydrogenase
MTTVHAYTSDQSLQDLAKATRKGTPDLRRMRAAALSIIPASTGAAKAIGLVLPELKGRLDGTSLRVPTPVGSITDLSAQLRDSVSPDDLNAAFLEAANDPAYRGVLEYSDEPLVSADIVGNPASCIFSALDTMANGNLVKVLGWYDNEWGYSNRLVELVAFVGTA